MLRNQLSETEAAARIASQLSIEKKKVRGDIIFDNQGTIADLTRQIDAWVQHFQETEQS
jgi:dephospho-CoA kinase